MTISELVTFLQEVQARHGDGTVSLITYKTENRSGSGPRKSGPAGYIQFDTSLETSLQIPGKVRTTCYLTPTIVERVS